MKSQQSQLQTTNTPPITLGGPRLRRSLTKNRNRNRSNGLQRCTDFQIREITIIQIIPCEHKPQQECTSHFLLDVDVINTKGYPVTYDWKIEQIDQGAIGSIPHHDTKSIEGIVKADFSPELTVSCTATCNGQSSKLDITFQTIHTEV